MARHQYQHKPKRLPKYTPEEYLVREAKRDLAKPAVSGQNGEVTVSCPDCGRRMAKRRSRSGNWFYGCCAFPACKATLSVHQAERPKLSLT